MFSEIVFLIKIKTNNGIGLELTSPYVFYFQNSKNNYRFCT